MKFIVVNGKKVRSCLVFTNRLGKFNIRLNLHGINLPEFASDHVHMTCPLWEGHHGPWWCGATWLSVTAWPIVKTFVRLIVNILALSYFVILVLLCHTLSYFVRLFVNILALSYCLILDLVLARVMVDMVAMLLIMMIDEHIPCGVSSAIFLPLLNFQLWVNLGKSKARGWLPCQNSTMSEVNHTKQAWQKMQQKMPKIQPG